MQSFAPTVSLRDLVFVLFKRKWGILLTISVALLSGLIWLFFVREDGYFVGAKVLVKLGREQAPPASMVGLPPMVVGYRQQDVNSEVDILTSTELVTQLVDKLGMDKPGPPPEVPASFVPKVRYYIKHYVSAVKDQLDEVMIKAGLRERLSDRDVAIYMVKQGLAVVPQKESNVVIVTLVVPFRQGSSVVLNTLLDLYQDYRVQIYADAGASKFFRSETDRTRGALRSSEEALYQLEQSNDIQVLDKQKETLLAQLAGAQEAARSAKFASDDASKKLQRLEQEIAKPEPNIASIGAVDEDSFASRMLAQLADLQREREKLRMTDLDTGDRIVNNRRQFQTVLNMLLTNLRSTVAERQELLTQREATVGSLTSQLQALHGSQNAWGDLKRRVKVEEDSYLFYKKKLEEASADTALANRNVSNVAIIERATDPIGPAGIRKMTLLGLILGAALLAAIVWAAIAEFFDHGVYTAASAERILGVPVVAIVPYKRRLEPAPPLAPHKEMEEAHAARS